MTLTEAQRHACPEAIPLLERMAHRRWLQALVGDKGDSSAELRNWLRQRGIDAVILYRNDEMGSKVYDRKRCRERPIIERTINQRKRFRRVATRYDTLASSYLTMVTIAMILAWP